jgi:hypothetical protein
MENTAALHVKGLGRRSKLIATVVIQRAREISE